MLGALCGVKIAAHLWRQLCPVEDDGRLQLYSDLIVKQVDEILHTILELVVKVVYTISSKDPFERFCLIRRQLPTLAVFVQ